MLFVLASPWSAVPRQPKGANLVALETKSNNHKRSEPLPHLLGLCSAKWENGIKRGDKEHSWNDFTVLFPPSDWPACHSFLLTFWCLSQAHLAAFSWPLTWLHISFHPFYFSCASLRYFPTHSITLPLLPLPTSFVRHTPWNALLPSFSVALSTVKSLQIYELFFCLKVAAVAECPH